MEATSVLEERVVGVGVYRDGEVGRNCPGRRRPDHGEYRLGALARRKAAEAVQDGTRILEGKRHVDRGVLALFVLELGFRERCPVRETPADRLQILKDETFLVELTESPRDLGF